MNDTFKHKGRNSLWCDALNRCIERPFLDYPEHAPYPCRVYDGSGNLKYELSRDQLIDRQFKQTYMGFVKRFRK